MPAERIFMRRDNPDRRQVQEIVRLLRKGEVIVIPTDTIYALACDMHNKAGIDHVCKLLGKKPHKANLSLICKDLSDLSLYCRQISNPVFKLMRQLLPGPFTFILNANSSIPKLFRENKKTVGIRVPDNNIIHAIVESLGNPLVSSSIHAEDEHIEYLTDPDEIYEIWQHRVNYIIDGGAGDHIPSTVLDCTEDQAVVIREGKGMELIS
ncbi:MAG: threonylcarbamoyl-AMP synthase [Flavobacteriales bacterium]|nr:threonylcarbamoyl-AMP synthase [Flavobacteriales bacterium]